MGLRKGTGHFSRQNVFRLDTVFTRKVTCPLFCPSWSLFFLCLDFERSRETELQARLRRIVDFLPSRNKDGSSTRTTAYSSSDGCASTATGYCSYSGANPGASADDGSITLFRPGRDRHVRPG